METRVVKEPGSAIAAVRTRCEACEAWNNFEIDELLEGILCGGCEAPILLEVSQRLLEGDPVDRCCRCGQGGESAFWSRKDFDPKLGVGIVVVASVLAFWTYGISLLVATVVDLVLWRMLPPVTTCYHCKTEYRGIPLDPAHGAFDLAHQEDLEQEQAVAARKRRGEAEPDDGPVL
jgi:hypothetical protein